MSGYFVSDRFNGADIEWSFCTEVHDRVNKAYKNLIYSVYGRDRQG